MNTGRVSILGTSILKGVEIDENNIRHTRSDFLGLEAIAMNSGYSMKNFSRLGCTVTKAFDYVKRMFGRLDADLVLMDFGHNDCDYDWESICKDPLAKHSPRTELGLFKNTYSDLVTYLKSRRAIPVLSTLLPVDGDRYIDYVARKQGLDKSVLESWIGDASALRAEHEKYCQSVVEVASEREVPLLDIRKAFLDYGNVSSLLSSDGVHPNKRGQELIRETFTSFMDDFLVL